MPYSYITLSQASAQLALRLADATFVRFLDDECQTYIVEALRTFGGLTGLFTTTETKSIAANTVFVDLPAVYAARPYTLTDQSLIGTMQYHLCEPKSVAVWTGTEMFTLADLTAAIQRRRDQFLLETGCVLTRHAPLPSPGVIAAGAGQYALDQTVVDINRAAWINSADGGKTSRLKASSSWVTRTLNQTGNGTPKTYTMGERAPNLMQFYPTNAADGNIDLISIDNGATLVGGTLLGIPDDYAWAVKWGALADLLSKDGPARDYARALYCERRYQLGVAACKTAVSAYDARVGTGVLGFTTLPALDSIPYWQNQRGTLQQIAPVGLNLLALYPAPSAATNLQLTMVCNTPVPAGGGNYVQIGKEYLDVILGYAEHLAMFKIGGQEFAATTMLADNFFAAAIDSNDRLRGISVFEDPQRDLSRSDNHAKPRRVARATGGTVGGPQGGSRGADPGDGADQ